MFGVMPGGSAGPNGFGAKVVSVFADPAHGHSRHQGLVLAFDPATGAIAAVADAETITGLRTACATAAATDALARADARTLAVFGTGLQAETHVRALALVRRFDQVRLWGRSPAKAQALATRLGKMLDLDVVAVADGREAAQSDVICTVSGAAEPILLGAWLRPGTHVNLVGSSLLGPVEADSDLVAMARYIADYRPGALAQASEFAVAREAGRIDDSHLVAEIGEVFAGRVTGRQNEAEITVYKSLGHVVQDLAATRYVHDRASCAPA
jgi:ornithine cyclodeaminase